MRLMVTGGGTGGHVYPGLSVIEALASEARQTASREEIAWVGSAGSMEESILAREPMRFYPISTGAFRGVSLWQLATNLIRTARGFLQSLGILGRFRPDAVLATGGYVSAPLVLAAWARRCPSLIYLPDMEPGLAIRLLSLFARRVAVSFEKAARSFPSAKVIVAGYPVRKRLYETEKQQALEALHLASEHPVLLILGGSQGAHSINEAVRYGLTALLRMAQVVHISGPGDHQQLRDVRAGLAAEERSRYHLYPYLHDQMPDALVAADLVIARAGAATLGEFPAVGLPAVLVPYPHAGQHQQVNAEYLTERGGAVIVQDDELDTQLLPTLKTLLGDPERLQAMRTASRALAMPHAAQVIAGELRSLAGEAQDD